MKEIKKVKITENSNSSYEMFLSLLDDQENEIIKMSIEVLTSDILLTELDSFEKYKKSIWQICGDLLKLQNPSKYIIEKEINKEFFGYFYFEDPNQEPLAVRPSDGIIISFYLRIPVLISNELYTDDDNETYEELNEKIKKAVAEENYTLAEELKKKRDGK